MKKYKLITLISLMIALNGCSSEQGEIEKNSTGSEIEVHSVQNDDKLSSPSSVNADSLHSSSGVKETTKNDVESEERYRANEQSETLGTDTNLNNKAKSYADISETQGIYIVRDGKEFFSAPEGHMWETVEGRAKYYYDVFPPNVSGIDCNLNVVPELKKDDELAIICEDTTQDIYIYPVKEDGYTIRAVFSEEGMVPFGAYTIKETLISSLIEEEYISVEEVNGQSYELFLQNDTVNTLEEYSEDIGPYSSSDRMLKATQGEEFEIGYFEGTSYKTDIYKADVHYFAYDTLAEKESHPIHLTKNGYGVIDVTELENGYYVINTSRISGVSQGRSDVYIIYINR